MILSNREIYIFSHNLIRARLITIARAADSIKEKTSTLLKCYFSRFQEFVAACLIRICRFPLAMVHVCNAQELRRYIPTYGCAKIRECLLRGLCSAIASSFALSRANNVGQQE